MRDEDFSVLEAVFGGKPTEGEPDKVDRDMTASEAVESLPRESEYQGFGPGGWRLRKTKPGVLSFNSAGVANALDASLSTTKPEAAEEDRHEHLTYERVVAKPVTVTVDFKIDPMEEAMAKAKPFTSLAEAAAYRPTCDCPSCRSQRERDRLMEEARAAYEGPEEMPTAGGMVRLTNGMTARNDVQLTVLVYPDTLRWRLIATLGKTDIPLAEGLGSDRRSQDCASESYRRPVHMTDLLGANVNLTGLQNLYGTLIALATPPPSVRPTSPFEE